MHNTFLCIILVFFIFGINCQGPNRKLGFPSSGNWGNWDNRGLNSDDENAKNDKFQNIRDFFKGASSRNMGVPTKTWSHSSDGRGLDGESRNMGVPVKNYASHDGRGLDGESRNMGVPIKNHASHDGRGLDGESRNMEFPIPSTSTSTDSRGLDGESRNMEFPITSTSTSTDTRGLDGESRNLRVPVTSTSTSTNNRGLDDEKQNVGGRFQSLMDYFRKKTNESHIEERDLGVPVKPISSSSTNRGLDHESKYTNTNGRGLDHDKADHHPNETYHRHNLSSNESNCTKNNHSGNNESHHGHNHSSNESNCTKHNNSGNNESNHRHNLSSNESNSTKHDKSRNLEESTPPPEQPSELIVDVSNVAEGFTNETQESFDFSNDSNSSSPIPPPFRGNETQDFDFSNFSNSSFPMPPPFRGNETQDFDFFTGRGPTPPFWNRGGNSSHSFLNLANFSDILQKSPFWQGGNGFDGMLGFSNSSEEVARGHPLPRSGGQKFNPWESLPKYGSRIPAGGSQNMDFMNVGNRFNPFDRERTSEATGDNSGPAPRLPRDKRP